ncbi:MAG: hypothetical protein LBT45_02215 [Rickettsiales bacterium]|jgi:hypothetical protein|nr:hypothetical protein [Rickettsiales bacterium]
MPLKKRNKLKGRIIFWLLVAAAVFLMIYVPKRPNIENAPVLEYELY